jgi:hypothetical protein
VAAGARGPKPSPQDAVFRGRGNLGQFGLEEGDADVEVAAEAARARQAAQQPQAAAPAMSLRLAHEQRQGHAQAPSRHPHLMQVFLAAGQRLGKASEDGLDPLLQQGGDAIGCGRSHGKVAGKSRRLTQHRAPPQCRAHGTSRH